VSIQWYLHPVVQSCWMEGFSVVVLWGVVHRVVVCFGVLKSFCSIGGAGLLLAFDVGFVSGWCKLQLVLHVFDPFSVVGCQFHPVAHFGSR
jgi:hypothetical protein